MKDRVVPSRFCFSTIFIYLFFSSSKQSSSMSRVVEDHTECLLCSYNQRDVIFSPCCHVSTCEKCAPRV